MARVLPQYTSNAAMGSLRQPPAASADGASTIRIKANRIHVRFILVYRILRAVLPTKDQVMMRRCRSLLPTPPGSFSRCRTRDMHDVTPSRLPASSPSPHSRNRPTRIALRIPPPVRTSSVLPGLPSSGKGGDGRVLFPAAPRGRRPEDGKP